MRLRLGLGFGEREAGVYFIPEDFAIRVSGGLEELGGFVFELDEFFDSAVFLLLYLLAVWGAYACQYMRDASGSMDEFIVYRFLPQVFGLTLMLLIICFLKGEKPRWRWGK